MRSREHYWSLYHSAEKNQMDNLRTDQVEAIFAALPKKMLPEWNIWREGFESWKPLEDFPQLLMSLRKAENQVVPLPPPPQQQQQPKPQSQLQSQPQPQSKQADAKSNGPGTVMARSAPNSATRDKADTISDVVDLAEVSHKKFEISEADDLDLSFEAVSSAEERNNFRFNKNFEVKLIAGNQVWQNRTLNISLKGMQLAQALPPNLPRYFNVELKHRDQVIQMVCSSVRSSDGSPSNRVKIEVNDFTPGLLAILLSA